MPQSNKYYANITCKSLKYILECFVYYINIISYKVLPDSGIFSWKKALKISLVKKFCKKKSNSELDYERKIAFLAGFTWVSLLWDGM